MKTELPNKIVLGIVSLSVIASILVTGYRFFFQKDYLFVIEASCDPEKENCFYRSCEIEDSCPPNNLENYKVFEISARDFSKCSEDSCSLECKTGAISCTERSCSIENLDECSDPNLLIPQAQEKSEYKGELLEVTESVE